MRDDKKIKISVLKLIFVLIITMAIVSGGSYALWSLDFDKWTDVAFYVEEQGYSCSADGGGEITANEVLIMPASCTNSANTIVREINTNVEIENNNFLIIDYNLWLNVDDLSSALSKSENFKYVLSTSDSCTENIISSGNFNGKTIGDKVELLNIEGISENVSNKYYLYIWLDEAETNPETANQVFDFSLGGTCDGVHSGKYTITYELGGGSLSEDTESTKYVVYGNIYGELPIAARDGYEFLGWYTEEIGGELVTSDTIMGTKNNHSLYARWGSISTVSFDVLGGTLVSGLYDSSGEYLFTAPYDGKYQLEVWGAQGGKYSSYVPGYGGYSVGTVSLTEGDKLYVNVGGQGVVTAANSTYVSGGYNGGGSANYSAGSGGGATHIATASGLLSSFSSRQDLILIVAGGGGGNGVFSSALRGGYGGGIVGGAGGDYSSSFQGGGHGGTQSSGGTFSSTSYGTAGTVGSFGSGGRGGYESDFSQGSGGGGGGFYGGAGGFARNGGGGGGSGYIGNPLLINKVMYCYECSTSSDENTLTYSTTNVSSIPTSNYAKSGNGAARISQFSSKTVVYSLIYGSLPIPTRDGYTFKGWNTVSDGSGQYITSDSIVNIEENHTLYAIWE